MPSRGGRAVIEKKSEVKNARACSNVGDRHDAGGREKGRTRSTAGIDLLTRRGNAPIGNGYGTEKRIKSGGSDGE